MTRRFAPLLALLVALGVAGVPSPHDARADEPKRAPLAEQAAAHFQRGVELYDEADFRTALIEFKRAHETLPEFRVLYNIAQCEYQLADYVGALDHFREYLEAGGAKITTQRRSDVERDIRRLEQRVAVVRLTVTPEEVELLLDGERVGASPLTAPIRVSAGQHVLVARKAGYREAKRTLALAGGDAPVVAIELTREGASVAPSDGAKTATPGDGKADAARSDEGASVSPATLGFIGAGVFAGAATVTGILALSASSDLKSARGRAGTTAEELDAKRGKTSTLALATDVLGGAALVSAGIALYFTLAHKKPAAAQATIPSLVVGRDGSVSLSLGRAF